MIRVMIVEDEPPIQKSIKNAIESSCRDFEVVACAFNGETAISMLKDVRPDVVFTDIRMPVMDGIQLMSYLSKSYPEIITVVISGYQEFEYAKKALQYHAFDYILKPLYLPELKSLLEKISSHINNIKFDELNIQLEKLFNEGTLGRSCSFGSNILEYKQLFIILLCAGSYPSFSMDYLIPARGFWEKINLPEKLNSMKNGKNKIFVINGKSSAEKIVILASDALSKNDITAYTDSLSSVLNGHGIPVTIVVSGPLESTDGIGYTSQLLRITLNKKIVIGLSQTIFLDSLVDNSGNLSTKDVPVLDKEIENTLLLTLKQGNINLFKNIIKDTINSFNGSMYPQILIEKFFKHIITLCQYTVSPSSKYDVSYFELEINEAITNSLNYADLFNNLWYVFEELFILYRGDSFEKNQTPELVILVENFLKENISEPITNALLSEKFGFVPSYISKIFKTYKSISPTEYLTNLRIEKAKELIKNQPFLLAKQIAMEVGYSDPLYFSRIFKKETGIWPSDFKKICG